MQSPQLPLPQSISLFSLRCNHTSLKPQFLAPFLTLGLCTCSSHPNPSTHTLALSTSSSFSSFHSNCVVHINNKNMLYSNKCWAHSAQSLKRLFFCSSQFGSVHRVSACGPKGPGFDSSQGHVPWLQAPPWPRPWSGHVQEATN
uniref:Uncharacterized protein n=1 Tax=Pipistrellus kuhlii TaxID=59472 RepID=A0A7J7YN36_PIPKU|nr:hypothetical protein mPipKuh1_010074 [Pipistrellus kuhlii]